MTPTRPLLTEVNLQAECLYSNWFHKIFVVLTWPTSDLDVFLTHILKHFLCSMFHRWVAKYEHLSPPFRVLNSCLSCLSSFPLHFLWDEYKSCLTLFRTSLFSVFSLFPEISSYQNLIVSLVGSGDHSYLQHKV